jgi:hypothetical protein
VGEQNRTEIKLPPEKIRAAQLVAEDELSDEKIAEAVGCARSTLWSWKKEPAVAALIDEIRAEIDAEILKRGIARRARRVRAQDDRWMRMQRLLDARAAAPEMQGVVGGDTGLLVHRIKSLGAGENFCTVDEYEVDGVLLRELREHEKQAAQELGQWTNQLDVTTGGMPFLKSYGFDPESTHAPDEPTTVEETPPAAAE